MLPELLFNHFSITKIQFQSKFGAKIFIFDSYSHFPIRAILEGSDQKGVIFESKGAGDQKLSNYLKITN